MTQANKSMSMNNNKFYNIGYIDDTDMYKLPFYLSVNKWIYQVIIYSNTYYNISVSTLTCW